MIIIINHIIHIYVGFIQFHFFFLSSTYDFGDTILYTGIVSHFVAIVNPSVFIKGHNCTSFIHIHIGFTYVTKLWINIYILSNLMLN